MVVFQPTLHHFCLALVQGKSSKPLSFPTPRLKGMDKIPTATNPCEEGADALGRLRDLAVQ